MKVISSLKKQCIFVAVVKAWAFENLRVKLRYFISQKVKGM
jgi:hypothetical protein